jgi:Rieske Fe-S protein
VLILMGAGAVVATGGLGAVLAACAGPPVTVTLAVDPASLTPGAPVEVPFTVTGSSGNQVPGSTWLVRTVSGELVAFDPRCTHGLCRYNWTPDVARFKCQCHEGEYALDGTVVAGPPPKPLMRFPLRETAAGLEVDVPSDFRTPKESLPA